MLNSLAPPARDCTYTDSGTGMLFVRVMLPLPLVLLLIRHSSLSCFLSSVIFLNCLFPLLLLLCWPKRCSRRTDSPEVDLPDAAAAASQRLRLAVTGAASCQITACEFQVNFNLIKAKIVVSAHYFSIKLFLGAQVLAGHMCLRPCCL